MSSTKYIELWSTLNHNQKQIMCDLYYKGVNHSGIRMLRYKDVEEAVVSLIMEERQKQNE